MKILKLFLFIIISINTFGQMPVTVHPPETKELGRFLIEGSTINGKKEGLWKKYYNTKNKNSFVSLKGDTLFQYKGFYKNNLKQGKWFFYGLPKRIGAKGIKDYKPKLDSIVVFDSGKIIKTLVFDRNEFLVQKLTRTDSIMRHTYYWGDNITLQNIDCFENDFLRMTIILFVDKKLKITKNYTKSGLPINEYFTYKDERNEILKSWREDGSISYTRTSYEKDYDIIIYFNNGNVQNISNYKDYKLYNKTSFSQTGEILDSGTFKNGNGLLKEYHCPTGQLKYETMYENGEVVKKDK